MGVFFIRRVTLSDIRTGVLAVGNMSKLFGHILGLYSVAEYVQDIENARKMIEFCIKKLSRQNLLKSCVILA